MHNIASHLYIGGMNDLMGLNENWSVAHVCKTAHKKRLGYSKALPPKHPHYVMFEKDKHLYVNWVDTDNPKYFDWPRGAGIGNMVRVLDFIEKELAAGQNMLIHCDQGISRSPSVGMVYLAKRLQSLPVLFDDAKQAFIEIYPHYQPKAGINGFLQANWEKII